MVSQVMVGNFSLLRACSFMLHTVDPTLEPADLNGLNFRVLGIQDCS